MSQFVRILSLGAALLTLLLLAGCGLASPAGENNLTPTSANYLPQINTGDEATPIPGGTPDLTIAYYVVNYTGDCPWGGPGEITIVVNNVGNGPAGAFDVTINGSVARVPGIPAGGTANATVTFDSGPVGSINALADSGNEVAESNENNNSYMIVFTPPPPCDTPAPESGGLPDLTVAYYWIDYTGDCPWGGPGTVNAMINNVGSGDAGPFAVRINGERTTVAGIPAGGSAQATINFSTGPAAGVQIEIDPDNAVAESNEENNELLLSFTPPPPCD
ncbi:MAG: hypothetical protein KDE29_14830 [Anaerolineales bacterium]|nr:hypothetical protein [Anaerolineales bacterium]